MKPSLKTAIICAVFVLIIAGLYFFSPGRKNPDGSQPATTTNSQSTQVLPTYQAKNAKVEVTVPFVNSPVQSPLIIAGRAKGPWFFEASFPVRLIDGNGKLLVQTHADASGDWMKPGFVPFTSTLTFPKPTTKTGTLILQNDNPSGRPETAEELRIPVLFSSVAPQKISLFYHKTIDGVDVCSPESVQPVTRTIAPTLSPLRDSINLLIAGVLTEAEKAEGFNTEFPNADFQLIGYNIKNGVATLRFTTSQFTSGGSCRTGILAEQIRKTALQFPSVKSVVLEPQDAIFQP